MTGPFVPPSPYGQPRVAHADLTLHYGDGKRLVMRVDAPSVTMERRYDRYDDVYSFGQTLQPSFHRQEVTLTLDGYLGEPERPAPTPTPTPAPAPAWSAAGADPVGDVRDWARRMRAEALPAVRDVGDVPTVDDLDSR